jgi:AAA domain-containing protein
MTNAPVIWLNGAFGAGKTTVARALSAQMPDCLVFDPENLGLLLRKSIPPELRTTQDFQDIPLWRTLTRSTIEGLLADYQRPLIVPMTVVVPAFFQETVGMLRGSGMRIHHFALVASPRTIRSRLLLRMGNPASTLWALRQIQRCTTALELPLFDVHVPTDGISVAEVVATIRRALQF